MEFFRDGGYAMWLMLFAFIGSAVFAATRDAKDRPAVLLGGCILSLILGILGMATGMQAVAANYAKFPEPLDAVAQGLRELSNNGIFSALLASLQGVVAWVLRGNLKNGR